MSKQSIASKQYMNLVRRFPLRPLTSDKELDNASKVFGAIGMKGTYLSRDERDYLDVLGKLIAEYERKSPRIRAFMKRVHNIPPIEILKSFMEDHNLSQSELARCVGIPQSVISEFLCGKRDLSKQTIIKFGNYFAVSPELFLPRH